MRSRAAHLFSAVQNETVQELKGRNAKCQSEDLQNLGILKEGEKNYISGHLNLNIFKIVFTLIFGFISCIAKSLLTVENGQNLNCNLALKDSGKMS